MKLIYVANIIVAGWIGIASLFFPTYSAKIIFAGTYTSSPLIQLVGALWLSIALLSIAGLWYPITFSPVLLLQLIYKSSWLIFVCVPALLNNKPYPGGMALFFIIWIIVLPFVIPWKYLFNPTH